MIGRKMMALVFAGTLTLSAADIFVRIGPPPVVVERRAPPPARGYVWISGYQRWDGNRYYWVPGRWERPPRARARWEQHRWKRRNGGWVFVEGRWR
jgi:YXWGXW repeat-containing protein